MEIFKRSLSALPINVDIVGHNRDLVLSSSQYSRDHDAACQVDQAEE